MTKKQKKRPSLFLEVLIKSKLELSQSITLWIYILLKKVLQICFLIADYFTSNAIYKYNKKSKYWSKSMWKILNK